MLLYVVLVCNPVHMHSTFKNNHNYIYIYIYREREREREMGSSYTWCNSYKLTPFLHRRFLRNLTVKKTSLNAIVFYLIT